MNVTSKRSLPLANVPASSACVRAFSACVRAFSSPHGSVPTVDFGRADGIFFRALYQVDPLQDEIGILRISPENDRRGVFMELVRLFVRYEDAVGRLPPVDQEARGPLIFGLVEYRRQSPSLSERYFLNNQQAVERVRIFLERNFPLR